MESTKEPENGRTDGRGKNWTEVTVSYEPTSCRPSAFGVLPSGPNWYVASEWRFGFVVDPAFDLDAREHGVAGDGMSDDTEAFASFLGRALAEPGAMLRIPRGIYRFDGEVLVPIPAATIDPMLPEQPHEP